MASFNGFMNCASLPPLLCDADSTDYDSVYFTVY